MQSWISWKSELGLQDSGEKIISWTALFHYMTANLIFSYKLKNRHFPIISFKIMLSWLLYLKRCKNTWKSSSLYAETFFLEAIETCYILNISHLLYFCRRSFFKITIPHYTVITEWTRLTRTSRDHLIQPPCSKQGWLE